MFKSSKPRMTISQYQAPSILRLPRHDLPWGSLPEDKYHIHRLLPIRLVESRLSVRNPQDRSRGHDHLHRKTLAHREASLPRLDPLLRPPLSARGALLQMLNPMSPTQSKTPTSATPRQKKGNLVKTPTQIQPSPAAPGRR